jgi:hypothetical protein
METEELTCESCNVKWTRQKSRGRKPKLCPSCVPVLVVENDSDDEDIEIPYIVNEPPLQPTKYKAGTKWQCSSCGVSIKIGIGHDEPPTHSCKKRLKRIIPLEKV